MRKILSILLAISMIICVFAGCSNDAQSETETTNNVSTKPTEETKLDNSDENTQDTNSYILSLKPTYEINKQSYPFMFDEYWDVENNIDDVSHLTNPIYEFQTLNVNKYGDGSQSISMYVQKSDWNEIKDCLVNDINSYSSYKPLYIESDDQNAYIVNFNFDDDLADDITIEQAYQNGDWYFEEYKQNGFNWTHLFEEDPGEDCFEAIVDTWGQPTEVYHKESQDVFVMFAVVYETEDHIVIFGGNEFLQYEEDNIEMTSITVCGKNSNYYQSIIESDFYDKID